MLDFTNLQNALQEYADVFIEMYQQNLDDNDANASGKLRNTITSNVFVDDIHYEVTLNLQEYYKYVQNGSSSGAWVPLDKMLEWINIRRILPRDGQTLEQMARSIQYSIFKNGSKGFREHRENMFNNTLDELKTEYETKIQEALYTDVINNINNMVEKYIF